MRKNDMFKNLNLNAINIRATMLEGLELAKTNGFEGLDPSLGEARKLADEHSVEYVKALFRIFTYLPKLP
jgi:hypothetical protein